ncbi:MAG: alpha-L-rhamnosidase N-terminal domain-containing protein [Planctomycetota bacterium]
MSSLTIRDLRCEYCIDPLGIDVPAPRLSWTVAGDGRGRRQTAYRIMAVSDRGDRWDTGRVRSSATAQIAYAGPKAASCGQVFWKVMVWDEAGRSSAWSRTARWTMRLLKPSDWKARWIGDDKPYAAARRRPAKNRENQPIVVPAPSFLRRDFLLARPIRRAFVYVTALGIYELYMNGQRVGEDFFMPGWTDYTTRVYYPPTWPTASSTTTNSPRGGSPSSTAPPASGNAGTAGRPTRGSAIRA